MQRINFFIVIITVFFACEETIILDTEQVKANLVVDAHLTNEEKIHVIELTQTVDFYFSEAPPAITTAEVTVTDITAGKIYKFFHNPANEDGLDGFYFSQEAFQGYISHEYLLEIQWNNEIYEATEKMPSLEGIDSLKYRINPFEYNDPEKPGLYYELLLYAKEPQETEDYYYFEFFRNDSLLLDDATSIYFTDDKFLQEQIKDLPSPVYYAKDDIARLKMFSITREAFIFLSDLFNVMNNDSGMFSPPPANPRNNISNGALGYFMVSAVESATLEIK